MPATGVYDYSLTSKHIPGHRFKIQALIRNTTTVLQYPQTFFFICTEQESPFPLFRAIDYAGLISPWDKFRAIETICHGDDAPRKA
jgi:hypothetical protein